MAEEQCETVQTTIWAIMRSAAFRAGVNDVRTGRPARFDEFTGANEDWSYERGRQWATLAPMNMPLLIGRRINPKAEAVWDRGVS